MRNKFGKGVLMPKIVVLRKYFFEFYSFSSFVIRYAQFRITITQRAMCGTYQLRLCTSERLLKEFTGESLTIRKIAKHLERLSQHCRYRGSNTESLDYESNDLTTAPYLKFFGKISQKGHPECENFLVSHFKYYKNNYFVQYLPN